MGLIFENDRSHGQWRWVESNHNWLQWGCNAILNVANTEIIFGWGLNRSLNQQNHPHVSRLKAEFNEFKYDCKRNWNLTCTWTFKLNVKCKLDEIEHEHMIRTGVVNELAQWLVFTLNKQPPNTLVEFTKSRALFMLIVLPGDPTLVSLRRATSN